MKLYQIQKLLEDSMDTAGAFRRELSEALSCVRLDDEKASLNKQLRDLDRFEVRLRNAIFQIELERQAKARGHGRNIKAFQAMRARQ